MHLRLPAAGDLDDGSTARDLMLPTADIVVLSAHDTELQQLAAGHAALPEPRPSLTLANFLALGHPLSVDLFVERTLAEAKLVVLRLLGGPAYWPHGLERLKDWSRAAPGRLLALVPGGEQHDPHFAADGTFGEAETHRLWSYLSAGGQSNVQAALTCLVARLTGETTPVLPPPEPPPAAGFAGAPPVGAVDGLLIVYRSLVQADDIAPIRSMVAAFARQGLSLAPVFVTSLKHPVARAVLAGMVAAHRPEIIVNATAFAAETADLFGDVPVLQVAFAGTSVEAWRSSARGLSPADLAMHVVLPELDGRIIAAPVAFKTAMGAPDAGAVFSRLQPEEDQVTGIARRAAALLRLRRTPPAERRIAIVLANYPNRDGRIANGVGLDTPQSCAAMLAAMAAAGYRLDGAPGDASVLMAELTAGPTNARGASARLGGVRWDLTAYRRALDDLPEPLREALRLRWGEPGADPHARDGTMVLALRRYGHVVVGIQPSRGYDIDPASTFHDPDLVPPHRYVATYLWLRRVFVAHALVHFGKHGNLEWLPGKSTGLSSACWPAALIGDLPHVYPFIVNDPGEGVQAKRRTAAVIVDHLTPPLARAGLHDDLARLESLSDEYALAVDLDPRRAGRLATAIAEAAEELRIDLDLGITPSLAVEEKVRRIDAHLCDLKEMQIRDGLHVFGRSPEPEALVDLAVAIARVPRPGDDPVAQSLTRALAADLGLDDCDPLSRDFAVPFDGPRPPALSALSDRPWRTHGDTVERLEGLARCLVAGTRVCEPGWSRTRAVLDGIATDLIPALKACGPAETRALLAALDGRHVAPGPSGPPSRGRPDVLPTGRNFYAVDPRAVPTEAAWAIGRASADLLVQRHWQEHGEWLRTVVLSAWGTANMRTGGDDVAQALALMGCRPRWEAASGRVVGFEIIPVGDLKRPRVDVTFRVSGLFRDAFPTQMDLIDSAARAVAALDEEAEANPLAEAARREAADLAKTGMAEEEALRLAATRVFGAKPGAYGAGLQALIDETGWASREDFTRAYLAWGSFAYGGGWQGRAVGDVFARRLSGTQAVVQAQDNREHDILDSDDYYQFMGGAAAAVETLSGSAPAIYHTDSSRPERVLVRTLGEEVARVVRGRAANPRWIAGVMRHGYKGAFEMAATVDYLFAFAATTDAVRSHHFDQLFGAFLDDETVRAFIAEANPAALTEMAERFREAIDRGLWQPRSNSAAALIETLRPKDG
ncbi:MAG: cobaltochelatase subunit CobN [Novosphingobium sp.]|nr:cobaltochelatase subunit CobN [Novosphingobium sp.]